MRYIRANIFIYLQTSVKLSQISLRLLEIVPIVWKCSNPYERFFIKFNLSYDKQKDFFKVQRRPLEARDDISKKFQNLRKFENTLKKCQSAVNILIFNIKGRETVPSMSSGVQENKIQNCIFQSRFVDDFNELVGSVYFKVLSSSYQANILEWCRDASFRAR